MSIISAGTSSGTALVSTGNTDGTLQLQVNGTTPSITLAANGSIGVGSSPSYGTSGQFLTSAGTGSAPTWTTPSAGAMTLISSATASNTALISFTGLTTSYRAYILEYDSVYAQTLGATLLLQFSTDNGSSYITSGYQRTVIYQISSTVSGNYSTSDSYLYAGGFTGLSTTSTQTASGMLTIFAPAVSGKIANTYIQSNCINQNGLLENYFGAQANTTTSAINAFKVYAGPGNIVAGNFRLYGLANT
jgi:hypothetical protein